MGRGIKDVASWFDIPRLWYASATSVSGASTKRRVLFPLLNGNLCADGYCALENRAEKFASELEEDKKLFRHRKNQGKRDAGKVRGTRAAWQAVQNLLGETTRM